MQDQFQIMFDANLKKDEDLNQERIEMLESQNEIEVKDVQVYDI